jgi:hypothetical protein
MSCPCHVLYQIDLVLHIVFFTEHIHMKLGQLFSLFFLTQTLFYLFFFFSIILFAKNDRGGRLCIEPSKDPHAKGLLWVTIDFFIFSVNWLIYLDLYEYKKIESVNVGWREYLDKGLLSWPEFPKFCRKPVTTRKL